MPFLFLSPSTQEFNPYVTTGNEEYWMNQVADAMEPYLQAAAINTTRNDPSLNAAAAIRASNAGTYDFHLALHSNAAPASLSGALQGTDVYYFPTSLRGLRMANLIVDNLRQVSGEIGVPAPHPGDLVQHHDRAPARLDGGVA